MILKQIYRFITFNQYLLHIFRNISIQIKNIYLAKFSLKLNFWNVKILFYKDNSDRQIF